MKRKMNAITAETIACDVEIKVGGKMGMRY